MWAPHLMGRRAGGKSIWQDPFTSGCSTTTGRFPRSATKGAWLESPKPAEEDPEEAQDRREGAGSTSDDPERECKGDAETSKRRCEIRKQRASKGTAAPNYEPGESESRGHTVGDRKQRQRSVGEPKYSEPEQPERAGPEPVGGEGEPRPPAALNERN